MNWRSAIIIITGATLGGSVAGIGVAEVGWWSLALTFPLAMLAGAGAAFVASELGW